ncbi:hypothetical protein [Pinirhizobacter soli]|uniref:hypothetical protein n=1 Tax=Pinirhizobacter soli TaxID=2786953 RepID=UPI002029DC52|nr:hypothetical protein [Pinirhizobacter soli]
MIAAQGLELHDAQLTGVEVRPTAREVAVSVRAFVGVSPNTRTKLTLLFKGVKQFTQNMDFLAMEDHSSAGNINYWSPALQAGTTYIYLVDGVIVVEHESIAIT